MKRNMNVLLIGCLLTFGHLACVLACTLHPTCVTPAVGQCSSTDPEYLPCETCLDPDDTLDTDYSCRPCETCSGLGVYSSHTCSTDSDNTCHSCKTDEIAAAAHCLNATSVKDCLDPSGGFCSECEDGYYSDKNICKLCSTCDPNEFSAVPCATEHNRICFTCLSCNSSSYEVQSCSEDSNTDCETCLTDTIASQGHCRNASDVISCTDSTTDIKCRFCEIGYLFDDGTCETCATGYYRADPDTCSTCSTDTIASQGHCRNASDVITCTDSTTDIKCRFCEIGYLYDDGTCETCATGYYRADPDTCSSCATSAIALEGNCLDVTSIKSCTSDTENIECEICAIGYEKDILTSTCNDCAMGYYVSEDGCSTCQTTDIATLGNCLSDVFVRSCANETGDIKCDDCAIGFDILNYECKPCATGYYPEGDVCRSCQTEAIAIAGDCHNAESVHDCKNETANIQCSQCPTNKYLALDNTCQECRTEATALIGNCLSESDVMSCSSFQDDIKCTQCSEGHFLNENSCTECRKHPTCSIAADTCATESQSLNCQTCFRGYTRNVSGFSCDVCQECDDTFYEATPCSTENNAQCLSCQTEEIAVKGNCFNSSFVKGCYSALLAIQCDRCADGFYVDGGFCKACATCGSSEYETTECSQETNRECSICTTCDPFEEETRTCSVNSDRQCRACTKHPTCDTANENQCDASGFLVCDICPQGSEKANGHACSACTKHPTCETADETECDDSGFLVCDTCLPGYESVNGHACSACTKHPTCETADETQCDDLGFLLCDTCPPGYESENEHACSACIKHPTCELANETQCDALGFFVCNSCPEGTERTNGHACSGCTKHPTCESAIDNQCDALGFLVCNTCPEGTELANGHACAACARHPSCAVVTDFRCTDNDYLMCQECYTGNYMIDSYQCTACTTQEDTCETHGTDCVGDTLRCDVCITGHYLTEDGICQPCSKPTGCDISNSSCDPTFTTELSCETCSRGYFFDSLNRCKDCGDKEYDNLNCLLFNEDGLCAPDREVRLCLKCEVGFYNDDSFCKECLMPQNCIEGEGLCSLELKYQVCTTPARGFYLLEDKSSVPCTESPRCADSDRNLTCHDNEYQCKLCKDPFVLDEDGACIDKAIDQNSGSSFKGGYIAAIVVCLVILFVVC